MLTRPGSSTLTVADAAGIRDPEVPRRQGNQRL